MSRLTRALATSLTAAVVALVAPAAADAETVPLGSGQPVTITGRGFGHGIGMSQYGARGFALQGRTFRDAMAFYYPGTALVSQGNPVIRVGITSDNDGSTEVLAAPGLRLWQSARVVTLPSTVGAATVKRWRLTRSGSGQVLAYSSGGAFTAYSSSSVPAALPAVVEFDNPTANGVRLVLPGGSTARTYRGSVGATVTGTSYRTVNKLAFEDYLAGVVPAEMPASWPSQALASQAVAARTYARNEQLGRRWGSYGFDTCDTTSCQVYKGVNDYSASTGALVATNTYASSTGAVGATAGLIATYGGTPALTQFSSSNGGYTAAGGQPYLPAKPDPWDAAGGATQWSTSVDIVGRLRAAYPSVGEPRSLVLTRDGRGSYGGRVTSAVVSGTAGSVTITGNQLRGVLGLRSTMMSIPATWGRRSVQTGFSLSSLL